MNNNSNSHGFLRAGVVSPEMRVADVDFNANRTISALEDLSAEGCQLAVFPELGLTGYSCGDLFYQSLLLDRAKQALLKVARAAREHQITTVVGLPLEIHGRLYNCAAVLNEGEVQGVVPKTYLPNTHEFYGKRWFSPADRCPANHVPLGGKRVPFGTDLLFQADKRPGLIFGIEICADLWAVKPPSGDMALAGATVFLNPSASNELLTKADYRHELVKHQSARCLGAYLYACSGPGESTTDVVYPGHSLIAENGTLLAETERFRFETQTALADIDLQYLKHERTQNSAFSDARPAREYRLIPFAFSERNPFSIQAPLLRPLSQTPFVPSNPAQRAKSCREIIQIQSTALAKRIKHVGVSTVTLGISGGLDSTLALLVTARAFDTLDLDRSGIMAVSLPGPGTTPRTRTNAQQLADQLGVTYREIPIHDAVAQHLDDIDHPEGEHDVTYENAQARERTQILMDLANQQGGFVVGTGDLSELALGWCTYNADHMSMYHVNAGVPKTLVRSLIEWFADEVDQGEVSAVLRDITATPITPELLPLSEEGDLEQKTEEEIGPFELHDFFLFHTVRHLFPPRKVYFLARKAFRETYPDPEILRWLKVFYKRFITQQFKRSAMPDGPKVGSVALSPRGDWRMPSDASSALWLKEVEEMEEGTAENK
jgi:NAD+ synthase (glutamine-hydrolysing)